jgi:IS5 family transposase
MDRNGPPLSRICAGKEAGTGSPAKPRKEGVAETLGFCWDGELSDWPRTGRARNIAAPSSTKNQSKERDPQMHQTKKGNMWHFGMKAHIGADAESGLVHTLIGTAANVADIACARELLHGEEKAAYLDAGYTGIEKRDEVARETGKRTWYVALKRGKIKKMAEGEIKELTCRIEKLKAQVRAKVEHPFHVVKNLFGHRKVRYRGLQKNTAQLHTLFGLANLVLAKRVLLAEAHA